jgi:hypothetical protein
MLYASGTFANLESIQVAGTRLPFYASGDEKLSISRRWTKAWIARNSEYIRTLKMKPVSAKRLATHIVEDAETHFTAFDQCKRRWGIQDEDISNFDETGFQIGVTSGEMVVVLADCSAVYDADSDNKELVTSVKTINYGGKTVPAMIIFQGADHLRKL